MISELKYKNYYLRKSGLKGIYGNILLQNIFKHKPKNFLEIGVYTGVTALNVCKLLQFINNNEFKYIGIDLFEDFSKNNFINEVAPQSNYSKKYFNNPIKNFFLRLIGQELNSFKNVNKFLNKFSENVMLYKGKSSDVLKKIDLKSINYIFLDGGHSFETVYSDLNIIYSKANIRTVIFCDDYNLNNSGVQKAIDTFVNNKKLSFEIIEKRFVEIII